MNYENEQPLSFWQGRVCAALNELPPPRAAEQISSWLVAGTPKERTWIQETLNDVYWFFVNTGSTELDDVMENARREVLNHTERDALLMAKQGKLDGVLLSRGETDRGVLFLPEASEPGRVRYSEFDDKGFFSHTSFDDYALALASAWEEGYREVRPESWFVSLSSTPKWQSGMRQVLDIQAHNLSLSRTRR